MEADPQGDCSYLGATAKEAVGGLRAGGGEGGNERGNEGGDEGGSKKDGEGGNEGGDEGGDEGENEGGVERERALEWMEYEDKNCEEGGKGRGSEEGT